MRAVFAIGKRLIADNKISFTVTAFVTLCATSSGDVVLSNGNFLWPTQRFIFSLTPYIRRGWWSI